MKRMIVAAMLLMSLTMQAQNKAVYDTIRVKYSKIEGFTKVSEKGTCQAIVKVDNDYTEFVSVSKSVREYIELCKEHKIEPSLALKLRNGRISSLIRLNKQYKGNVKK